MAQGSHVSNCRHLAKGLATRRPEALLASRWLRQTLRPGSGRRCELRPTAVHAAPGLRCAGGIRGSILGLSRPSRAYIGPRASPAEDSEPLRTAVRPKLPRRVNLLDRFGAVGDGSNGDGDTACAGWCWCGSRFRWPRLMACLGSNGAVTSRGNRRRRQHAPCGRPQGGHVPGLPGSHRGVHLLHVRLRALKAELENVEAFEFIFTSPTFVAAPATDRLRKQRREFFIPQAKRESTLYGSEFEIRLRNKLTQRDRPRVRWVDKAKVTAYLSSWPPARTRGLAFYGHRGRALRPPLIVPSRRDSSPRAVRRPLSTQPSTGQCSAGTVAGASP